MEFLEIASNAHARWKEVGAVQGLPSDTHIALYLLRLYEDDSLRQASGGQCPKCQRQLIVMCQRCQTSPLNGSIIYKQEQNLSQDRAIGEQHQHQEPEKERSKELVISSTLIVSQTRNGGTKDSVTEGRSLQTMTEDCLIEQASSDNGNTIVTEEENKEVTSLCSDAFEDCDRLQSLSSCCYESATINQDICNRSDDEEDCLKVDKSLNDNHKMNGAGKENSFSQAYCNKELETKAPSLTRESICSQEERKIAECLKRVTTLHIPHDVKPHRKTRKQRSQYLCPDCDKTFIYRAAFNCHLRLHKKMKMFKCGQCQQSFLGARSLQQHSITTHQAPQSHRCGLCDEAFQALDQLKTHAKKNCRKAASAKGGKQSRGSTMCENSVRLEEASTRYESQSGFSRKKRQPVLGVCCAFIEEQNTGHYKDGLLLDSYVFSSADIHDAYKSGFSIGCAKTDHDILETETENIEDRQHDDAFSTSKNDVHQEIPMKQKNGKKDNQKEHLRKESKTVETSVHCLQCGARVSRARDLKIHMRIHTGEKPYVCSSCQKAFRHRASFSLHVTKQRCKGTKDSGKPSEKKNEDSNTASRVCFLNQRRKQRLYLSQSSSEMDSDRESNERRVSWDGVTGRDHSDSNSRHLEALNSSHRSQSLDSLHIQEKFGVASQHQDMHQSLLSEDHHQPTVGSDQTADENISVNQTAGKRKEIGLQPASGRSGSFSDTDNPDLPPKDWLGPHNFSSHLPHGRQPLNPNNCVACHICGVSVSRQRDLKIHMRIHSGEKPYLCSECGAEFRQAAGLLAHNLRKHSGQRPYVCDQCGSSFALVGSLNQHMRIHNEVKGHTCQKCGKSFLRLSDLKGHVARHLGIKRFACGECGKSFCTSSELSKHKTLHTGEKPHTCFDCRKAFRLQRSLKRHMKTHAKDRAWQCAEYE